MIEVIVNVASDESYVDLEVVIDEDKTIRFECLGRTHAMKLKQQIEACSSVEEN